MKGMQTEFVMSSGFRRVLSAGLVEPPSYRKGHDVCDCNAGRRLRISRFRSLLAAGALSVKISRGSGRTFMWIEPVIVKDCVLRKDLANVTKRNMRFNGMKIGVRGVSA